MALRCAVLDDYQNVALSMADWSPVAKDIEVTVFDHHLGSSENVIRTLKDFEIVVIMRERTSFRRDVIDALPKLKLLITTGHANRSIDLVAAQAKGVTVCGTSSYGNPTTGIVFGLMLELTRKIGWENARLKAGATWQNTIGADIEGQTIGIVGLGKLGTRVAGVAKAFGMNVLAWSPNLTAEKAAAGGAEYASKEDLFARSDFVTIHVQLSDRSRGLIGAADLARMKPSAYLINTARAPIVDETALIAALKENRIAGAGLDVFEVEPLPLDHPYRGMDNVVITPHLGYVSQQNYEKYFPDVVGDIRAWLDGAPVRLLKAPSA